jgi:hypothetical protein
MKPFILIFFAALSVTACSARVDGPDRARVYVPGGVVVEADGFNGAGPRHCPPGHAKKGWC